MVSPSRFTGTTLRTTSFSGAKQLVTRSEMYAPRAASVSKSNVSETS